VPTANSAPAQEPLCPLNPISQTVLKIRVLLGLLDPVRDGGPNHIGDGLILHPSNQFEVVRLIG